MTRHDLARLAVALACSAVAGAIITLAITAERITRPTPRRPPLHLLDQYAEGTIAGQ